MHACEPFGPFSASFIESEERTTSKTETPKDPTANLLFLHPKPASPATAFISYTFNTVLQDL